LKRRNTAHEQTKKVTVQHPHLASPIEGEETFFPRPWWEGLGEGVNCYKKELFVVLAVIYYFTFEQAR